jgi:peptidyl-prolyl cis-trans isomerase D
MLRGIKKASANWLGKLVLGVVMFLLIISFGIWGIGDIFRGFGTSTLAKVGRTEISVEQFRQIFNDRLRQIGRQFGRNLTIDQARALGLDQQVLGQVVAETALDERARALRLSLPDAEIAKLVTSNPDFRSITGQFDRAQFERQLRENGFTEGRYVADLKKRVLRSQLALTVSGGMPAPKSAVDAVNRYENEQRNVEYIKLDRDQAGDIPAPSADALAAYFEQHKAEFRAPEYRKLTLLVLTPADAARWIEVSDADAKRYFEERGDRYSTPERRQIQQIRFANAEEAREAAEKIAKGQSFADLAAERGLKPSDIDLGLIVKSAVIDRTVADAAFALKEGAVSEPVQGRFGTVLLHVVKVEPGQARSYDDLAPQIKRDIALERGREEVRLRHDKIEDERLAGGTLAEVAQRVGLEVRSIDAIDEKGRAPDGSQVRNLPQGGDVLRAAFAAEAGADSDPVRVDGGYIWYEVSDITPWRMRPLDDVKDQVESRWRDDEIAARLRTKATEMVDKAKAGGSLRDIAAANRLTVETATGVKRGTRSDALPPKVIEDVFRAPKDAVTSTEGDGATQRVVFRVTDVTVPKIDMESAEAKQITDNLRRALENEILNQYIFRLQNDIGTTVNQNALTRAIGSANN